MAEPDDWDKTKENIQPLKQGRSITATTFAEIVDPKSSTALNEKRAQLDGEIASYRGDDPLAGWVALINWVEASYPKGGSQGGLPQLVKDCCMRLWKEGQETKKYFNDERFIQIWIKLAAYTNTLQTFDWMEKHSIGVQCPSLYISWAGELESMKNSLEAERILERGLAACAGTASDVVKLRSARKNLLDRDARSFIDSGAFLPGIDDDEERNTLGGLRPVGKEKKQAPINRVGINKIHSKPILQFNDTGSENNKPDKSVVKIFESGDDSTARTDTILFETFEDFPFLLSETDRENLKVESLTVSKKSQLFRGGPQSSPPIGFQILADPELPAVSAVKQKTDRLPLDRRVLTARPLADSVAAQPVSEAPPAISEWNETDFHDPSPSQPIQMTQIETVSVGEAAPAPLKTQIFAWAYKIFPSGCHEVSFEEGLAKRWGKKRDADAAALLKLQEQTVEDKLRQAEAKLTSAELDRAAVAALRQELENQRETHAAEQVELDNERNAVEELQRTVEEELLFCETLCRGLSGSLTCLTRDIEAGEIDIIDAVQFFGENIHEKLGLIEANAFTNMLRNVAEQLLGALEKHRKQLQDAFPLGEETELEAQAASEPAALRAEQEISSDTPVLAPGANSDSHIASTHVAVAAVQETSIDNNAFNSWQSSQPVSNACGYDSTTPYIEAMWNQTMNVTSRDSMPAVNSTQVDTASGSVSPLPDAPEDVVNFPIATVRQIIGFRKSVKVLLQTSAAADSENMLSAFQSVDDRGVSSPVRPAIPQPGLRIFADTAGSRVGHGVVKSSPGLPSVGPSCAIKAAFLLYQDQSLLVQENVIADCAQDTPPRQPLEHINANVSTGSFRKQSAVNDPTDFVAPAAPLSPVYWETPEDSTANLDALASTPNQKNDALPLVPPLADSKTQMSFPIFEESPLPKTLLDYDTANCGNLNDTRNSMDLIQLFSQPNDPRQMTFTPERDSANKTPRLFEHSPMTLKAACMNPASSIPRSTRRSSVDLIQLNTQPILSSPVPVNVDDEYSTARTQRRARISVNLIQLASQPAPTNLQPPFASIDGPSFASMLHTSALAGDDSINSIKAPPATSQPLQSSPLKNSHIWRDTDDESKASASSDDSSCEHPEPEQPSPSKDPSIAVIQVDTAAADVLSRVALLDIKDGGVELLASLDTVPEHVVQPLPITVDGGGELEFGPASVDDDVAIDERRLGRGRKSLAPLDAFDDEFDYARKSICCIDQTFQIGSETQFFSDIDGKRRMASTPKSAGQANVYYDEDEQDENQPDGGKSTALRQYRQSYYGRQGLSPIIEQSRESKTSSSSGSSSTTVHCRTGKKSTFNTSPVKEDDDDAPPSPAPLAVPVDPYDSKTMATFRANLQDRFAADPNVVSVSEACPKVTRGKTVVKMGNKKYKVEEELGAGNYATVYSVRCRSDSTEMWALKFQVPEGWWDYYIQSEALARVQSLPNADRYLQHLISVEQFQRLSDGGSFTFLPIFEKGNIVDLINTFQKGTSGEKTVPEFLAIKLSIDVLRALEALHAVKIIHGDVKADNFLVRSMKDLLDVQSADAFLAMPSVVLTDFGCGIDMTLWTADTTFSTIRKGKATAGFEILTAKPWTYQVDYFGILDVMHSLLFGDYMKVYQERGLWRICKSFKRHWSPIWDNTFRLLLNVESCEELPRLAEIRQQFEEEASRLLQGEDIEKLTRNLRVTVFMQRKSCFVGR